MARPDDKYKFGPEGDLASSQRFTTLDEVKTWLESEMQWWHWLLKEPKTPRSSGLFNTATAALQDALNHVAGGNWSQVEHSLNVHFRDRKRPYSGGKAGEALLALDANNHVTAVEAARVILESADHEVFRGLLPMIHFSLIFHGISDTLPAISSMERAVAAVLAQAEARHNALTDQFTRVEQGLERLQEQRNQQQSEYKGLHQRHEESLKAIKKKYHDEMAIRSAVTYWSDRRDAYRVAAREWGVRSIYAFLGVVLLAIGLIYGAEPPLTKVTNFVDKQKVAGEAVDPNQVNALLTREWLLAIANRVVIIIILVWPLRILIRNYMSCEHLSTDAAERHCVLQTYLALVNDPDVVKDGELKKAVLPKALEHIFRHTQTGIVRDDAFPQIQGWLPSPMGK